jgi:hypothetical protein
MGEAFLKTKDVNAPPSRNLFENKFNAVVESLSAGERV